MHSVATTRYCEARTLVRRIHRLPSENREDYKKKVVRLRSHFEQFSVDVSDLCQWLMSLRPGGKRSTPETEPFWEFFLEPGTVFQAESEKQLDRDRRLVFDLVLGLAEQTSLSELNFPAEVISTIRVVSALPRTRTTEKLFERLAVLNPGSRQVLLKAAAEWIVARYWRGYENWVRQREEWSKEKEEWESDHPELTESIRSDFDTVFKSLSMQGEEQETSLRRKNPRICSWDELKEGRDNCRYTGERINKVHHGPLCVKYRTFLREYRDEKGKPIRNKFFLENALKYLELRIKDKKLTRKEAMQRLVENDPRVRWFQSAWPAYIRATGITKFEARGQISLPHCTEFADDKDCEFNPHTELCTQYRNALTGRPDLQEFEELYREWRKSYLAGPKKPSFKYPSARKLPMPKIFGDGYYRLDFSESVIELRYEDMAEGEFVRFGFDPWPKDYDPRNPEITSVHINFVGTRPRAGFRFEVPRKPSRFNVTQDEIDELRSRKYPRQKQDAKFLEEARALLTASFQGNPERELRLMAVDLGETGSAAGIFNGKHFEEVYPLKIIKIERLYDAAPESEDKEEKGPKYHKGLSKDHTGLHLESWVKGAEKIAERRKEKEKTEKVELRSHDMRRLSLHMGGMMRDWVRLNASQIVQVAEENKADLIVFESLRGFRARGYDVLDMDQKRRLAFFAYGRIRRKVTEKAVERGMCVVTIPYFKSSQVCSECGRPQVDEKRLKRNKLDKRLFECEHCDYRGNSDANAARVLGRVFWGEITLPSDEKSRGRKSRT